MAVVGDILFCYALLIATFFRMMQYFLSFLNYYIRKDTHLGGREKLMKVMRGKIVMSNYAIELLPMTFLVVAPVALVVSATDSEYAGIALLLSIASLGQLGTQQRAAAGFATVLERVYRWTLIVSAVLVMAMSSGFSFLRTEVSGLHLARETTSSNETVEHWRTIFACIVTLIPVQWSSRIVVIVLGHFCKVSVALMVLLVRRAKVVLVCKAPNYLCALSKLTEWIWGPNSHRVVMTLLFVSTMAGDLSWLPEDSEPSESDSCSGSGSARAIGR